MTTANEAAIEAWIEEAVAPEHRTAPLTERQVAEADEALCAAGGDAELLVDAGGAKAVAQYTGRWADVEVLSVRHEAPGEEGEGDAYWVHARVGDLVVRLYAAPQHAGNGRNGRLEPCGGGIQDWCAPELIDAWGIDTARVLGCEAIARARI